jgi:hypothetical protein
MPGKFHPLATYNAECQRGIVHTPAWDAQMAELQREFDGWDWRQRYSRREWKARVRMFGAPGA